MATLSQPPSSSPPTYEKILISHGLKRQEMQQQISDDALFPIARQMTRWRSIDLGLKKGTVNSIENDPTTKEEEKQVKLLERWRESYGHDATYERLAFSFCSSNRVDLADTACEMRKKARAGSECESELWEESETDHIEQNIQPFLKAEEATTTDEQGDFRGIPAGQPETIGAGQKGKHRPSVISEKGPIPEEKPISCDAASGSQEQSNGGQSTHMVASGYPPTQPNTPNTFSAAESPNAIEEFIKLTQQSVAHMDKLREERVKTAANSDNKVRELLDRNNAAAWLIVEKERQVGTLKGEVQDMQTKLKIEQEECKKVKEGLAERDSKISQFESKIKQQGKELKEVKDDQHKLTDIREELNAKLEEEKKMKKEMEQMLACTTKQIEHLETSLEKAQSNVDTAGKERECLESVMKWTMDDVEEEEEEDDEITWLNSKLQEKDSKLQEKENEIAQLRKRKRIYQVALLFVVLILACLVLSRVPITCSLFFGGHTEL